MEIIHPPGGYFGRKEREKSPFVGTDDWLGQKSLRPDRFSRSFLLCGSHPCDRWAPPFQAGYGLNSSYNGIGKNTLKTAVSFVMSCTDKVFAVSTQNTPLSAFIEMILIIPGGFIGDIISVNHRFA
jgi:hypothetical protein